MVMTENIYIYTYIRGEVVQQITQLSYPDYKISYSQS